MIPAGFVNALTAWANDSNAGVKATRTAALKSERDALIAGVLNGGKSVQTLKTGSANGKSFEWFEGITREEKLSVLTRVLEILGAVTLPPESSSVDWRGLQR